MAAPYYDISSKLEEAIKSLVDALGLSGVTINKGITTEDLTLPYVVCGCTGGQEDPEIMDVGIWRLAGQVMVASSQDDTTEAAHRERVATVFDAIVTDGIAADLSSAVTDFYCYDVEFGSIQHATEEKKMTATLEFSAVCCAYDIT